MEPIDEIPSSAQPTGRGRDDWPILVRVSTPAASRSAARHAATPSCVPGPGADAATTCRVPPMRPGFALGPPAP